MLLPPKSGTIHGCSIRALPTKAETVSVNVLNSGKSVYTPVWPR